MGVGDVHGFLSNEILSVTRDHPQHWPYCREWVTTLKGRTLKETIQQNEATRSTKTSREGVNSKRKLPNTSAPTQPERRKRRTIEDIRRVCGSNVVAALEKILKKEAKEKNSLVQRGGRNRRPYGCDKSLDDLIFSLNDKYGVELAQCSDSTLKGALPHFVACPRGRPRGITEKMIRKRRR